MSATASTASASPPDRGPAAPSVVPPSPSAGLVVPPRRDRGVWGRSTDALGLVVLLIIVLFLVPSRLTVPGPLKSVGAPATLLGFACLATWVATQIVGNRPGATPPRNPGRLFFLFFAAAAGCSFAAGMLRPLNAGESSGAVRATFALLAALGVGLIALDGLRSRRSIETVVRTLVVCAGVSAFVGILQFYFVGFDYYRLWDSPFLVQNNTVVADSRSLFNRVQGGAVHPIEFSVALASMVPLGLYLAKHGDTNFWRRVGSYATVAMLVAIPMSVARSAVIALAAGLIVASVDWNVRARLNALILGIAGLAIYRTLVPGLLGTLKSLFTNLGNDPSVDGRTADYAVTGQLFDERPVFGMGIGTFQPETYFYLDNQWLGTALEQGLVGVAAMAALFLGGMTLARGARVRSADAATRGLGQAIAASLLALALAATLFDEFGFRQTGYSVMLLVGMAGALWRLNQSHPRRITAFRDDDGR